MCDLERLEVVLYTVSKGGAGGPGDYADDICLDGEEGWGAYEVLRPDPTLICPVLSDPITELDLLISACRPRDRDETGLEEEMSTLKKYATNKFVLFGVFVLTLSNLA